MGLRNDDTDDTEEPGGNEVTMAPSVGWRNVTPSCYSCSHTMFFGAVSAACHVMHGL